MKINERFTEKCLEIMRTEIEDAGGNEVFFAGAIDVISGKAVVTSVKACARGNESEVCINFEEERRCSVLIHNHPSGVLKPSGADLQVASNASENARGFYIVNNDCTDCYAVVEPILPKTRKKISPSDVSFYLSEKGPFASKSDFFEERPSQLRLTEKISESFNKNGIGVFEAGTGVGKSFAYLIPSMLWALENKERVVISTGTINLQQQLSEKDIPQAEKILGKKIKSVLLKGRQNYVCLRRLDETKAEQDWFTEEKEIFDRLFEWAENSESGNRSDLAFLPPESVWSKINSESDACMGMKCPNREKCFVMKTRKEAIDANIIVVNHHLLFADIESRMNGAGYDDTVVLPPYRRVIFDEAHGIEHAATSFFSESLNRFKFSKQLNYIYRTRRGSYAGYLMTLSALSTAADIDQKISEIESEIYFLKQNLLALDITALELLDRDYTLRLFEGTASVFQSVIIAINKFLTPALKVCSLIRKIIDNLSDNVKEETVVWETKTVLKRLEDYCSVLKNFTEWSEHTDSVFWIQKNRLPKGFSTEVVNDNLYVSFTQTPLDIAPLMNSGVYEMMDTVCCTSATLGIGKKFDFWKRRVGVGFVPSERVLEGEFESPFPYKENVLFSVPSDAPMPGDMEFAGFAEDSIVRLIEAAAGRTLVLFTSYDLLKSCCEYARLRLSESGINVLKQGDDDRFRLLANFKDDVSSVLFATDSFWEGVDVPGDALSQVIIVKLPFDVPSDPVFAARSEACEKRGGNPFMEISVPDAVIKFRQGFGRLVRRNDDKGSVVVLDRRLVEKRYGSIFMQSIPMTERIYCPLNKILERVTHFFS